MKTTGIVMCALLCGIAVGSLGGSAAAAGPTTISNSNTKTNSWDTKLPSSSRFTTLTDFGGAAVRDNQTGLVWEQAPDASFRQWATAVSYCANKNVGGTVGWRLPSVVELKSVQDPSLPPPYVPDNVFTGIQISGYWSATTDIGNPSTGAWSVLFNDSHGSGFVGFDVGGKLNEGHTWCVRGPMQESAY